MSVLRPARHILCLYLVVFSLVPFEAAARTWYVKVDGSGDVPRLQDAVDLAQPGDTVLVGPGRYTWSNQGPGNDENHGLIVMSTNRPLGVTYISEEGPENTILDAERQGRTVFINGDNNPNAPVEFTFSGFTVTGGKAPVVQFRPFTEGGGMVLHLVYPIIENCIFIDNEAESGGGVFAGGLSSIQFRNCQFINNRAFFGAGLLVLHSYQETTIEDCTFRGNVAYEGTYLGQPVGGHGAGLYCYNNRYRVERCTFYNNRADLTGSGFYSVNSKPGVIRHNTFLGNSATFGANPEGGANVHHEVRPTLGEGTSDVEFHNNLIAFNGLPAAMIVEPDVVAEVACNDIYGNEGGDWTGDLASYLGAGGNVSEDPLLCAEDGATWTVAEDSPVLAANNACTTDIGLVLDGGPQCGNPVGLGEVDPPEVDPETTVAGFRVHRAAPSPFLPTAGEATTVSFDLPATGHVKVEVYDLAGRRVRRLASHVVRAGRNEASWSGHDDAGRAVAAGVYLVRVQSEQRVGSTRVVVIR